MFVTHNTKQMENNGYKGVSVNVCPMFDYHNNGV